MTLIMNLIYSHVCSWNNVENNKLTIQGYITTYILD